MILSSSFKGRDFTFDKISNKPYLFYVMRKNTNNTGGKGQKSQGRGSLSGPQGGCGSGVNLFPVRVLSKRKILGIDKEREVRVNAIPEGVAYFS